MTLSVIGTMADGIPSGLIIFLAEREYKGLDHPALQALIGLIIIGIVWGIAAAVVKAIRERLGKR